MPDVNPEPRAIDEEVDRSIPGDPPELDLAEVAKPPGFPLAGARQASSAASESQTVKSPRFWRHTWYSAQFRTRYRDLAYLYWLRFGYLTGAHSRVRGFASTMNLQSGAMLPRPHHEDAKPGDLGLQLPPIRFFSSSKKFSMT